MTHETFLSPHRILHTRKRNYPPSPRIPPFQGRAEKEKEKHKTSEVRVKDEKDKEMSMRNLKNDNEVIRFEKGNIQINEKDKNNHSFNQLENSTKQTNDEITGIVDPLKQNSTHHHHQQQQQHHQQNYQQDNQVNQFYPHDQQNVFNQQQQQQQQNKQMKRMISEQREDGLINFGDSFGRRAEFLKKTVKKEIAQMKGENVSKGRNQNGEEKEEKQEIEGKEANAIHNDVKENENEKENIFNENYENNKQQQQQQQQQIVSLQNSQFEQSFSDFGNLKAISHKNSSANGFFVSSIPHSLHSFDSSHSEEPSNRRKSTADTALSQNLMDRRNIMQKQETEQRNNESGTVEEKTMNANDYYNNEMENAEDRVKQNAQRMLDIILPFLEEKMSSNASSTSSSFSSLPPSSSAVSTCTNTVPVHIPKPSFFEEEEAISLPIQKVPSLDQTANRAGLNDASSASLVGYSSLPVLPQCKQNSFSSAMGIASSNELEKKEANGFVESNSIDNPDGVLV